MKDTALISILSSFSRDEMKSFGKFVTSPFHNDRKDVVRFFKEVKKFHPGFNATGFTKEKLHSKLYKGKNYSDGEMRKMISYLLKLAEDFMSYTFYKNDEFFSRKFLVEELNQRRLFRHFNKKFDSLSRDYEHFRGQYDEYFVNKYYLEITRANNFLFTGKYHLYHNALLERISYLIYFCIITLSYNYTNLLKAKTTFNIEHESNFVLDTFFDEEKIKKIIDFLKEKKDSNYAYLAVYYYSLMSFYKREDETHFRKFREVLLTAEKNLSWIDRFNLHLDLGDICFRYILDGKEKYKNVLISIYEEMLRQKLVSYYPDGVFSLNIFLKIIRCSLYIDETKWAENFLNEYIKNLSEETQKNTLHFCNSLIQFSLKNFEKAQSELSMVNYELYTQKLDVRDLQIRIYYEMEFYEQLFSMIDSYKHFLSHTETIAPHIRTSRNEFLNIVNRLTKIKLDKEYDELYFLKKEIDALDESHLKKWLLEKIHSLTE